MIWPMLILASGSPRRRDLLAAVGADATVVRPRVDETPDGGDPAATARRLARAKAEWAARRPDLPAGRRYIVAADTLVVSRRRVLGKPNGGADARRMLGLLSNRWHEVVTGVCLLDLKTGRAKCQAEVTRVKFRKLAPSMIRAYVASGEPLDKAGAYGIQGRGAVLVERIEGCYSNVVGLPLARLAKMLERSGALA